MKKNKSSFLEFEFDRDRRSSLVLILTKELATDFNANKFLKKYYSIDPTKDEGESQSCSYLSSLKSIKKLKSEFSFGFDFVAIKSKDCLQFTSELFEKNFGEVWIKEDQKYNCIANLNTQDENDVNETLKSILGETKLDLKGILVEVVVF
jgi:hypothetical protein